MAEKDPVAKALDEESRSVGGHGSGRIVKLFGDRPDVLESIRKAYLERKLSPGHIAKILARAENQTVSKTAVEHWLEKEGYKV